MAHVKRCALPRRGRRAFTLVETLVLIAIVVVLVALVLSGGWYARQRARVFQCTANLHELSVAVALYVNDYRTLPLVYPVLGDWPPAPPSPPPDHDAEEVLGDYVRSPRTFICPVAGALGGPPRWERIWSGPYESQVLHIVPGEYEFNPHVSGRTLGQVTRGCCPASKCLVAYDPESPDLNGPHLHRFNALFLDGHVRAYPWIVAGTPAVNTPWPPD